ncbi:Hypp7618 [Branchiostoma lanceolatum]|uniref:Hypp7618 protein n=1 Tax=Branchiostoma lanceolatum TaxID=7740 RepID=A0A8J9Z2M4_BRALA|nr:Hypp7618 [Branchiostoma lanceolatum]
MEWLEQQTISTAPVNCTTKLWKRYVDDVLELLKRGAEQQLTDHLNTIDSTGNIKFTHETEEKEAESTKVGRYTSAQKKKAEKEENLNKLEFHEHIIFAK